MKYTTKTTKAQMEIMGLAVIVILLALGMFFVTKFSLQKEKPTAEQTFQQRQLASTFVSTLLSTNAGCGGSATFTELIEDLAAPEYSLLNCGAGTLEDYFKTNVKQLLTDTLEQWGYIYELNIVFPGDTAEDIILENGCAQKKNAETKLYPIPSDYGTIRVQMKICY